MKERFPWTAVIAVGVLAWALGFAGFTFGPERAGPLGVLDNAWRSFALFAMQSNPDEKDHWCVVLARLLAPAATLGGIYGLSRDYLTRAHLAQRLRGLRGHLVIIGLGSRGRAFRDSCKADVAALDIVGASGAQRRVQGEVLYQVGDGRDLDALKRVGVDRARSVLILTGDDAVNLEILTGVIECRKNVRSPLSIVVRLQNPTLARQLDRQDEFVRRGVGQGVPQTEDDAQIEVLPFDVDRLAAQQLLRLHPLVDLADLRGQRRVHVVVIGWTGFALAFLEQLARLAPYKDFETPRVDLMVPRPDGVVSELEAVQPALLADLRVMQRRGSDVPEGQTRAGSPGVLQIHLHELREPHGLPTPDQIVAIEPGPDPRVTAVLVTLGSDDRSAASALALRERCSIFCRWQGPIFVEMKQGAASFRGPATGSYRPISIDSTFTTVLERRARLLDPAEQVVPVGTITGTCELDHLFGSRERAAKAFHMAYVKIRSPERRGLVEPSEMPWPLLAQTYRNGNRRAADHLPIKVLSAGYVIPGHISHVADRRDFAFEEQDVRKLAELEHRSWEVDRLLDGWSGGSARDNRSRTNETIGVPYELLPAWVKHFDVELVKTAAGMLASAGPPVQREIRIGLIGHNQLDPEDKLEIVTGTQSIPSVAASVRSGALISLVTPLAPGSDLVLAESMAEALDKVGAAYRLVVVRTLPFEVVVAEFVASTRRTDGWSLRGGGLPPNQQEAASLIQEHVRAWLLGRPSAVVVNLLPPGSKMEHWIGPSNVERRRDAFRRANAYVVSRCHSLVAFLDEDRGGGPGGTAEALAWARDFSSIPPEFQPARGASATGPEIVLLPGRAGHVEA